MNEGFDLRQKQLSAKDYAYFELKELIIRGEMSPNDPIIEEKLASNLEISRTPLREALQRLEWEGLVSRRKNGRLEVASISTSELKELFKIRSALEAIIVVHAAKKATEEDIGRLENCVQMISFLSESERFDEILQYGKAFHNLLYEMSELETSVRILRQLNDHIDRYRRLVPFEKKKSRQSGTSDHEKILKLIVQKDFEGVAIAMEEHILKSAEIAIAVVTAYEDSIS
ncbi:GntR family transcriptional regulator [Sporosarcina sp. Marseille-Q4943]|uniref:GntR family transcriptional regulator n=1 Tax=Sporosarcina sp. Marseille-Q4943 TaxID=2942204 RepID=UPI00208DA7EE|nr:GntR family transcriptional regulator [Sporosarcina sp. Marseille-Q4943]